MPTHGKTVQFDSSAKQHDGLGAVLAVFDEYVTQMYRKPTRTPIVLKLMVARKQLFAILTIQRLLQDVLSRYRRSPRKRVPVLPQGGGGNWIVTSKEAPRIRGHALRLSRAVQDVKKALA